MRKHKDGTFVPRIRPSESTLGTTFPRLRPSTSRTTREDLHANAVSAEVSADGNRDEHRGDRDGDATTLTTTNTGTATTPTLTTKSLLRGAAALPGGPSLLVAKSSFPEETTPRNAIRNFVHAAAAASPPPIIIENSKPSPGYLSAPSTPRLRTSSVDSQGSIGSGSTRGGRKSVDYPPLPRENTPRSAQSSTGTTTMKYASPPPPPPTYVGSAPGGASIPMGAINGTNPYANPLISGAPRTSSAHNCLKIHTFDPSKAKVNDDKQSPMNNVSESKPARIAEPVKDDHDADIDALFPARKEEVIEPSPSTINHTRYAPTPMPHLEEKEKEEEREKRREAAKRRTAERLIISSKPTPIKVWFLQMINFTISMGIAITLMGFCALLLALIPSMEQHMVQ